MISVYKQLTSCGAFTMYEYWGKDFLNLKEKRTLDWRRSTLPSARVRLRSPERSVACGDDLE
ncbi:hypothetical protein WP5W18E02_00270 [Aeromonas caviae]|nr:hypothetical protein WP5W18E02_00270 [Aeromonas caviae]